MGYIIHQFNVPIAKFHQHPADVISCRLSTNLDWLTGNNLLPHQLKGSGDQGSKNMLWPPCRAAGCLPSVTHPGAVGLVNRFLLRGFAVHLFECVGAEKRENQALSVWNKSVGFYLIFFCSFPQTFYFENFQAYRKVRRLTQRTPTYPFSWCTNT